MKGRPQCFIKGCSKMPCGFADRGLFPPTPAIRLCVEHNPFISEKNKPFYRELMRKAEQEWSPLPDPVIKETKWLRSLIEEQQEEILELRKIIREFGMSIAVHEDRVKQLDKIRVTQRQSKR